MNKLIFHIVLLFIPVISFNQIPDFEKLENSLPNLIGIEKLKALNELRIEFEHRNRGKSYEYALLAVDLADSIDTTIFNIHVFTQIGIAHLNVGHCSEAGLYLNKADEYLQNNLTKEKELQIDVCFQLGRLYACYRRKTWDEINHYNDNISSKNYSELIRKEMNFVNEALKMYYRSIDLIESNNLSSEIKNWKLATVNRHIAHCFTSYKEYDKAFEYFLQSYENYKSIHQKKHASLILAEIGNFYRVEIQNYPKAIEYTLRSIEENTFSFNTDDLSTAKQTDFDDLTELSHNFANIGFCYYNFKDYKNALKYYLKLYEADKIREDTSAFVNDLNYVGRAYYELGDFNNASKYYDTVLFYAQQLNNIPATAQTYYNKGLLLAETNQMEQSIEQFTKSLLLRKEIGWYREMGHSYQRIGEVNEKAGNFHKAENNLMQALEIARQLKDSEFANSLHLKLSVLYEKMGNFEKSLFEFKQYKTISDSLVEQKQNELIIRQQVNFDLESKESELVRQKEEEVKRNRQKAILISISSISLITVVFLVILLYYFRYRNKLKRDYVFSEQKALRAQMNPHFIFNSLGSIQNFVLKEDSEAANDYLSKFSSLIRLVLENSKYNTISLVQELETIKTYLYLEQMRFDNKFDYSINLPQDLSLSTIELPPMLVQPFLENAILHGITPMKGKGYLELFIEEAPGSRLKIVVRDNGIGRIEAEKIKKQRLKHKSTGMKNVEERFALLSRIYKAEFKITIEDLYKSDGKPNGTQVIMEIPIND